MVAGYYYTAVTVPRPRRVALACIDPDRDRLASEPRP